MSKVLRFLGRAFARTDSPGLAVRGTAELALGVLALAARPVFRTTLEYLPAALLMVLIFGGVPGLLNREQKNPLLRVWVLCVLLVLLATALIWPPPAVYGFAGWMLLAVCTLVFGAVAGASGVAGRIMMLLEASSLVYFAVVLFSGVRTLPTEPAGVLFLALGAFDWALSPVFAGLDRQSAKAS